MEFVLPLIFALALVQSLFGVGLLLFGTPLLLGLGFEYQQALMWLLPASIALSWSQVWEFRQVELDGNYRRRFFGFCIPALMLGMLLSLKFAVITQIKVLVLLMLVLTIVLRLRESWFAGLRALLAAHVRQALAGMGLIHGLSNMGGSLLAALASGLYQDKSKMMAAISLDYAFMASSQLVMLLLLRPELWNPQYLIAPALSLSARYLVGRKLFILAGEAQYQHLMTALMCANSCLLGWTLFHG